MKMWLGREREGKYKDLITLFIGDKSVTINDIKKIAKDNFFGQIYFGAGMCTEINQDVIKKATMLFPKHIITIEIDYKELNKISVVLLNNSNINFIITITDKGFSRLQKLSTWRIQVKVQHIKKKSLDGYLAIGKLENFDVVDTQQIIGKTYKGDKVLL